MLPGKGHNMYMLKKNEMNEKELAYFAYESAVLAGDVELSKKLYVEYVRICYTVKNNVRYL